MKTLTPTKIKTIDIQAKEWFDRLNGNSYFAAQIFVNYGLSDEKSFKLPFQYGYESASKSTAIALLFKEGIIETTSQHELREQGITVNWSKQQNCLQRDVKAFGL